MIEQLRAFIKGETKVDLYNNQILEVAVRLLEAWKAGLPIQELKPDVMALDAELRNGAITKRSKHNPMQDSHDNVLGHQIIDALYGTGFSKAFLDHKGLWITGKAHDSFKIWKWTFPLDSEFFANWRPEYRGMSRFVLAQESYIDRLAVHGNLALSTTANLLRARLLLLEYIGVADLEKYHKRLGDDYKGRYGDEPVINGLWSLQ